MTCSNKHDCFCGTGPTMKHNVGELGCERLVVEAPIKTTKGPMRMYIVDGQMISSFSLFQQRHYHQHLDGCWSKHPDCSNSLPDET